MKINGFWERVQKTNQGCWEWQGARTTGKCGGYGELKVNGKVVYAHRVAWILSFGDVPANIEVCHKCDNRGCCNPSHLFLGTHKQNMKDMFDKGRNKGVTKYLIEKRQGGT